MLLRYSVSFESDLQPVRTGRGEIDVPNPRLGVRRALEGAQKQCPKAHWRSLVVVLEKVEVDVTAEVPAAVADMPADAAEGALDGGRE